MKHAGIVERQIEPAIFLLRPCHQRFAVRGDRAIGPVKQGLAARLGNLVTDRFALVGRAVADDDHGSFGGHGHGRGAADTAATAGDDGG